MKKLFLFLVLLLITTENYSKVYLVTTVSEINSIMSSSLPGDTLLLKNGIWNNVKIVIAGNGSAELPIVIKAQSPGQVTISGSSNLAIGGKYLVVDGLVFTNGKSAAGEVISFKVNNVESQYCRLTNCSIIDFNTTPSTTDNKWVSLYGKYNRVDHCYFKGKTNLGTTLVVWMASTPNYHRIDHNHFGFRPVYPDNGAETIRVGTSDWSLYDSFTTVEYNLFDECNGEIEIISSKSCGNIYRYNTFRNCQGTLTLRHGNRCIVEGNFFMQGNAVNSGGIRVIGEDHLVYNNYIENTAGSSYKTGITLMNGIPGSPLNGYYQVKRAKILFNTLVNCKYTLNIGGGNSATQNLPPVDCEISNNLAYSLTGPMITYNDIPVNMTYSGNIFYGSSLGITAPSGITVVNPLMQMSNGLLRPASQSPAINNAVGVYPNIVKDIDGQVRTGVFDIGADEYSSDPITVRPLTINDVGPYKEITTSVKDWNIQIKDFELSAYPNPFNPETNIIFTLPKDQIVKMIICNSLGEQVRTLLNENKAKGSYKIIFNSSGLSTGVYYCVLTSGNLIKTYKLLFLK